MYRSGGCVVQADDGRRDDEEYHGVGDVYKIFFFQEENAYQVMPNLVGSEKCIRERGE